MIDNDINVGIPGVGGTAPAGGNRGETGIAQDVL